MMVSVLLVLVGIMLLGAGLFYLSKNKQDAESRKIYGITALIGVVVLAAGVVSLIL